MSVTRCYIYIYIYSIGHEGGNSDSIGWQKEACRLDEYIPQSRKTFYPRPVKIYCTVANFDGIYRYKYNQFFVNRNSKNE